MRTSRLSQEQIAMALRQGEVGTPVPEICRKLGVSEATFYRWKRRYGGLGVSEPRELRQLREENRKLKGLQDDPAGDAAKKVLKPARWRAVVEWARLAYGLSERWACRALGVARSTIRYRSLRPSQEALRRRLRELAAVRVRSGYRPLRVFLGR